MGRTSVEVKDRWNSKSYDDIRLRVPIGRKADIEAYAMAAGESVMGLIGRLLREEMGMTEAEWKKKNPADAGSSGFLIP